MIEELKQLIELIKDLPNMALWILFGFAVYKTFIFSSVTGSLYYGFKFAVGKWYDAFNAKLNKKADPEEISINNKFITSDGTMPHFFALIEDVRGARCSIDSQYLHLKDVQWLQEAVQEKKDREAAKKEKKA